MKAMANSAMWQSISPGEITNTNSSIQFSMQDQLDLRSDLANCIQELRIYRKASSDYTKTLSDRLEKLDVTRNQLANRLNTTFQNTNVKALLKTTSVINSTADSALNSQEESQEDLETPASPSAQLSSQTPKEEEDGSAQELTQTAPQPRCYSLPLLLTHRHSISHSSKHTSFSSLAPPASISSDDDQCLPTDSQLQNTSAARFKSTAMLRSPSFHPSATCTTDVYTVKTSPQPSPSNAPENQRDEDSSSPSKEDGSTASDSDEEDHDDASFYSDSPASDDPTSFSNSPANSDYGSQDSYSDCSSGNESYSSGESYSDSASDRHDNYASIAHSTYSIHCNSPPSCQLRPNSPTLTPITSNSSYFISSINSASKADNDADTKHDIKLCKPHDYLLNLIATSCNIPAPTTLQNPYNNAQLQTASAIDSMADSVPVLPIKQPILNAASLNSTSPSSSTVNITISSEGTPNQPTNLPLASQPQTHAVSAPADCLNTHHSPTSSSSHSAPTFQFGPSLPTVVKHPNSHNQMPNPSASFNDNDASFDAISINLIAPDKPPNIHNNSSTSIPHSGIISGKQPPSNPTLQAQLKMPYATLVNVHLARFNSPDLPQFNPPTASPPPTRCSHPKPPIPHPQSPTHKHALTLLQSRPKTRCFHSCPLPFKLDPSPPNSLSIPPPNPPDASTIFT